MGFGTRNSCISLLESSLRPGWSNSMKKWKQVTEKESSIDIEGVLDHAVHLQKVFKVEGEKKIKVNLFFFLAKFTYMYEK